ncbi:hypothetical protein F0U62_45480 [Cystobacter fuscus]|uniref:hypothetical protein n=1 Tax=Cystobacter fuscus TaxID=43 RepID=UPI002B304847|nr:hypothetical protein F0U62_45480 [Cystobacter fuscus]
MLKISRTQMQVLEQEALRSFENRAATYLKGTFPMHWQYMGEEQVRRVIRHGVERARTHQLVLEQDVAFYLSVMFMLGSGFDEDPQYPWAAGILSGPERIEGIPRASRLHEKVLDYANHALKDFLLEGSTGNNKRLVQELHRIRWESNAPLPRLMIPDFIERLMLRLKGVFPNKCAYIGEAHLRCSLEQGVRAAAAYGLGTERGSTIFVALSMVLGSGFAKDPLVPWADPLLNDASPLEASQKAEALYGEAMMQLKRWTRGVMG